MDHGKIEKREITTELKESYLDYAMSVIVGRALPDARDGLKPVHRRILWAMWDMGLTHTAKFVKSARVVGECFIKGTLITTAKGLVPIEEVSVGDEVYTQQGSKKVTRLYEMPPKSLLRVTLNNGLNNIVTPSQRIKVLSPDLSFVWKEAKDLTDNDYVVLRGVSPSIQEFAQLGIQNGHKIYLNENIAYLLGLFVSDGWITNDYSRKKHARIGFVSANKKVLVKIQCILEKEFSYFPHIETKEYKIKNQKGQTLEKRVYVLRINRKTINEFLTFTFNLENKNALTKEIPRQIFQSPQSVIFSFMSGLFEGDGCVSKRRNLIQYGSISEKLADQLMILLFSQGFLANKYTFSASHKKERFVSERKIINRHLPYSIEIRGEAAVKFASQLSFADDVKNSKRLRLSSKKYTNFDRKGMNAHDVIPYAGKVLFQELSRAHLGSGWYKDYEGNKFRMGIKYPSGSKIRYSSDLQEKPLRTTQVVLWGIKEKLRRVHSSFFDFIDTVISNNLLFMKVSSITPHTALKTYDLEVESDHEFIANGMVSHNCLGKYHPHGEIAVYDSLVRMAQDFSLRYPLIQGQGNFGSLDGDSAAAQRYTECKLSALSEELLTDIEKETVDFMPNYDGAKMEPKVLPSKVPNLLINGSDGIAVGMATKIPPHNLSEVIEATIHLAGHENSTPAELMQFIQGPDFPTGGIMYNKKEITEAYISGRGKITVRGVAEVDEKKIVITEIPYQVNKAELIIKIAELVQEKRIEGIRDLRDESDKDGLRVVVELKSDAVPQKVLNQLWNFTDLQKDFHMNMLALPDGLKPRIMSIKEVLASFITHREEVVRRRAEFDLKKARERAHILEGLAKALSVIDKIIATIKKSADKEEAKKKLIEGFKLSDLQATAILEMKLQTLAALERQKIDDELKEKQKLIKELTLLLKSKEKILEVVTSELRELKAKFGDERRTKIHVTGLKEFNVEDMIPAEEAIVTLSGDGYIKRLPPDTFKRQRRGGKGLIGTEVGEDDIVGHFFKANTHDNILFFTASGKAYQTKVYEIPVGSRTAKGKAIHNFLEIPAQERISALITYSAERNKIPGYLVMLTEKGVIKKTALQEFQNVRRTGIIAIKLSASGGKKGDHLKWVKLSSGKDELILTTSLGQSIRFKEGEVRPMGRAASGVKAISLKKDDLVSAFDVISSAKAGEYRVLAVMANGFAKMTSLKEYKVQGRGGKGILTAKVTAKTGSLVSAHVITEEKELLAISVKGQMLRTELKSVRGTGRAAQGVRIMRLRAGDKIAGTVCL